MSESTRPCPFCGAALPALTPSRPVLGGRIAYDPWKGRLWAVCGSCWRWSQVPLALRWETLEACEEAVHAHGRLRLSSNHLSLVEAHGRELVRVGKPPRIELASWRYGDALPRRRGGGFLRSLFAGLPPPPVDGYRPYALGRADPPAHWVLSPFQDAAWGLTTVFTAVPLAPVCPSCRGPVALHPWSFHLLRLVETEGPKWSASCALCGQEVALDLRAARAAVRLGLSVVDGTQLSRQWVESAAVRLDETGGAQGWVETLARESASLGDLDRSERATLAMALDEDAEIEALELEWREEEEIAEIMDGELSSVPGFEAFRHSVLSAQGEGGF